MLEESSAKFSFYRRLRSVKSKLSPSDCRYLRLIVKRTQAQGDNLGHRDLADLVNVNRRNVMQVSHQTIGRALASTNVVYGKEPKAIPPTIKKKAVSCWLRSRRGFAVWYKKLNAASYMNADEFFFGLAGKLKINKPIAHIKGLRCGQARKAQGLQKRINVNGAVGPAGATDLQVFMHGNPLSGAEHARMLDAVILSQCMHLNATTLIEDRLAALTSEDQLANMKDLGITYKRMLTSSGYLAAIEKVWANVKDIVYKNKETYQTKEELAKAVRVAWLELVTNPEYRKQLHVGAREACRRCVEKGGYEVHWK